MWHRITQEYYFHSQSRDNLKSHHINRD
jgi:hypothetical protein